MGVYEHPLNEYKDSPSAACCTIFTSSIRKRWASMVEAGLTRESISHPWALHLEACRPERRGGQGLQSALEHDFTRTMEVSTHGTSLPVENNSFSLDPELKDAGPAGASGDLQRSSG